MHTFLVLIFSLFFTLWIKPNNRLWVEYNKNKQLKQHNDWMHKSLPRDAIHSARSLLPCCVRLFVTLMYRNGQTYYQTFSSPGSPIILVFQKGKGTVKFRRGHPQQIEVGYQKFAVFNQYFRNTDTEYRTDMKKNTDENTENRYRPSSSGNLAPVNTARVDG